MFPIVVVSTNSCTAVDFLNQFALQNEVVLQSALVGSLNTANSNKNAISVIDASSITANDVHTLKQVDMTPLKRKALHFQLQLKGNAILRRSMQYILWMAILRNQLMKAS